MHTHPRLEATGSDNGEALKGLAPGNQEVKVAYEETKLVETQGRGTSYLSTWAGPSPLCGFVTKRIYYSSVNSPGSLLISHISPLPAVQESLVHCSIRGRNCTESCRSATLQIKGNHASFCQSLFWIQPGKRSVCLPL